MRCAIALAAICVLGCGPQYIQQTYPVVHGPDGRRWWEMTCRHKSWCRQELSRLCPGGYETTDETTESAGATAQRVYYTTVVRQYSETSLLFRCKSDPP